MEGTASKIQSRARELESAYVSSDQLAATEPEVGLESPAVPSTRQHC